MALSSIGGLLLRPAAGWALDTIGRRPTLVFGTLVLALGLALMGGVDRIGPLVICSRILVGIGAGTLFTAYFTLAADVIPPSRRTEGIALFGVSGLLPLWVNPAIDAFDPAPADLRWAFAGLGVVVLLSMFFVLGVAEPAREKNPDPPSLKAALRTLVARNLLPVWLACIVFSALVAGFNAFVGVTASAHGIAHPSVVWLTYAGAAVTVRVLGPGLPARVGPRNLLAPAMAAYIVACILVAGSETQADLLWAGASAGLAHGYCFPVLTSQTVTRAPAHRRGTAMAGFTALWELAVLAFTPLFGRLADATDDSTLFASLGLCGVVGLALWAVAEQRLGPRLDQKS
jgi:MFS family permease